MVQVKKATALTNKQLKVLPSDVADAIVAACDAILDDGRCMDQFPTDSFQGGAGTALNMNTNGVVGQLGRGRVGGQLGGSPLGGRVGGGAA
ncbi:lyase family protein, partial [Enterococcus faecium]|uniref:lyase family protein n=1 Tax=Enterococcus faecium TaxID=1352 RepID=UPI00241038CE